MGRVAWLERLKRVVGSGRQLVSLPSLRSGSCRRRSLRLGLRFLGPVVVAFFGVCFGFTCALSLLLWLYQPPSLLLPEVFWSP